MHGYVADKQTAGILVERDRAAENARQERSQARERHQASLVVQQKGRRKIVIAAVNAGAGFSRCELAFHVVVAEFPMGSVDLGADYSQRLEDFEQAHVFVAIAFEHRERIVGGVGVDGYAFFFR